MPGDQWIVKYCGDDLEWITLHDWDTKAGGYGPMRFDTEDAAFSFAFQWKRDNEAVRFVKVVREESQ